MQMVWKQLHSLSLAVVPLMGMLVCLDAQAQRTARGRVRITDLDVNYTLSPKYQDESTSAARRNLQWAQIMLEYESEARRGEWIDEIIFDWAVAVVNPDGPPLLLKNTVTYTDVKDGRHHAAMYIRPRLIERYYRDNRIDRDHIAFRINVTVSGEDMGTFNKSERSMPRGWWSFSEPRVILLEGELLTRLDTPFAPLDYDYYEHIKSPR